MADSLIKLTNPEFQIEFDGKEYMVRKANLDKVVQYFQKVQELQDAKDPAGDFKIVSFCLFLLLKDKIPDLTQDIVAQNVPGDIDVIDTLATLGFINPEKVRTAKNLQKAVIEKLTMPGYLSPSPSEQGGVPIKSESSQ